MFMLKGQSSGEGTGDRNANKNNNVQRMKRENESSNKKKTLVFETFCHVDIAYNLLKQEKPFVT